MPTINGKACVANGRNLIVQSDLKSGYITRDAGSVNNNGDDFHSDNYIPTNGATIFTLSSPDYAVKLNSYNHTLSMYDSEKKFLGYQIINSATQTLSNPNTAYIRISINFTDEGGTSGHLSDWLANHRYKLEKGTVATPETPVPVDKVFSDGRQVYGRNLYLDTKDITNTDLWYSNQYWTKQADKYNSLAVMQATSGWNGLSQYVKVKTGETYTFSLYAMYTSGTGNSKIYWLLNATESGYASAQVSAIYKKVNLSDNWQRVSATVTITADGYIRPRIERTDNNSNVLQIAGMKLEAGTLATPWTPAPEDVM